MDKPWQITTHSFGVTAYPLGKEVDFTNSDEQDTGTNYWCLYLVGTVFRE